MKPINTRVHGVLDYLAVVLLFALPRVLGWSDRVTLLLTVVAVSMLGASLLTRYELGAFKVLPMRAHLVLDFLAGALLIAAGAFLSGEPDGVRVALGVLGLAEVGTALLTQPASSLEPQPGQAGVRP